MQVRARGRESTYILHSGIDEMPLQPQRGSWSGSESDSIDKDIAHRHTLTHTHALVHIDDALIEAPYYINRR